MQQRTALSKPRSGRVRPTFDLAAVVERHGPAPELEDANVVVRIVDDEVWPFGEAKVAPLIVCALDSFERLARRGRFHTECAFARRHSAVTALPGLGEIDLRSRLGSGAPGLSVAWSRVFSPSSDVPHRTVRSYARKESPGTICAHPAVPTAAIRLAHGSERDSSIRSSFSFDGEAAAISPSTNRTPAPCAPAGPRCCQLPANRRKLWDFADRATASWAVGPTTGRLVGDEASSGGEVRHRCRTYV